MSKMQRNKGSAFERWCCNEIKDHLGYENVRRNLSQYQEAGGADILIPHWSIECKRYAKGPVGGSEGMWRQAVDSGTMHKLSPCLIVKYDRHEPTCRIFLSSVNPEFNGSEATVIVDMPTWFYIVREAIPF